MLNTTQKTALQKAPFDGVSAAGSGLAYMLNKKVGVLKCTYDFAVQGGAVSQVQLYDDDGNLAALPIAALVTQVYSDVVTAVTTGASGTLSLDGNSVGDLKAALAAASYSGTQAGVPVGTAATTVKLTAARNIKATIATGALTAGKVNFFLQFVLSD